MPSAVSPPGGPAAGTGPEALLLADDFLQPFQVGRHGLRGRLVRLGDSLNAILRAHDYPEPVSRILGECLALAVALAGALKYDGIFTLQAQSDGPVSLLVADVTSQGALRGYARFDAARLAGLDAAQRVSVPHILGSGHLAFTVDQGPNTERYQGITALEGASLAECVHHYFRQSEQLETAIMVAAGEMAQAKDRGWGACALMVQRMPAEGGHAGPAELAGEEAEEAWRESIALMGSATRAELLDPSLGAHDLLFRLFHEAGVRVFAPTKLVNKCRCSRERVITMLGAVPAEDIDSLEVAGEIRVTCEFCSHSYVLHRSDL